MDLAQKQKVYQNFVEAGGLAQPLLSRATEEAFAATDRFIRDARNTSMDFSEAGDDGSAMGMAMIAFAGSQEKEQQYLSRNDTPFTCGANYYASVLKTLGFEQVGHFKRDNRKKERWNKGDYAWSHVYVHARPDGLLLTWDTHGPARNAAKLTFQWRRHAGSTASPGGTGSWYGPDNAPFMAAYLDAREGVRGVVASLFKGGEPLPVWQPVTRGHLERCFILEGDYSHQKFLHPEVTDFFAELRLVDAVQKARLKRMPKWVKQMLGAAPLQPKTPAP